MPQTKINFNAYVSRMNAIFSHTKDCAILLQLSNHSTILSMNTSIPTDHFNEIAAGQLASLFDALSDPTRLRIIAALLDGEMNVGELVAFIGLSKSAVSHQLRGLRDKRLVRSRKQGRQVYVTLDDDHVAELFKCGLDHVRHG
jgi:ArsR family transcriptional regulator, lead/cadmium/zinc/bismuth-responsive transcriptional repressor